MKYISSKNISLLACLLLIACQSEDVSESGDGNFLQVLSVNLENEGSSTKAVVSSIDNVNVYATHTAESASSAGSSENSEIAAHALSVFSYEGSSWGCETPPELADDPYNIYAYYPLKRTDGTTLTAKNSSDGKHYIEIVVNSENSFSTQNQDDYLYADQSAPITASKSNKAISFIMKHALAKVSFEITKDASALETLTLTKVEIVSRTGYLLTGQQGKMYLNNGKLTALSSGELITLKGSVVLKNSLPSPNVSSLVAPMDAPEKALLFRLTVSVGGIERVFETSTVKNDQVTNWPGVQWQAGLEYIYQIKVSKMGGTISGVTVHDWKKDSDQNTQVGI